MKKSIFILGEGNFERIYEGENFDAISGMTDVVCAPMTADEALENGELLKDVEFVFSGWGAPKLSAEFLNMMPKLEAVFYGAGSIRGILTDEFWERDIIITSSYGANAVPVAEYAVSQIILSLKHFWRYAVGIKQKGGYIHRDESAMPGGYGSTVGLVSLGMIGAMVAERLKEYDLNVVAYDPFASQEKADNLGVKLVSLDDVFSMSDVVSLHAPNIPETRKMIKPEHFELMKANSTFINTARGAIVDEEGMLDILEKRADLFALLDVTLPEPPAEDSRIYTLDNVIYTPHIAGSLSGECKRMGEYAVNECRKFLNGEELSWNISKEQAAIMA
ncbi:MAG: hydroxyacid dehydrogenase [Kiritimatiellae bacterium]|nr:hydroxyacid dehydrogenase [Kiritimatiellia bacterium]